MVNNRCVIQRYNVYLLFAMFAKCISFLKCTCLHMFIHVYSDSIWFPFILDREGEVKEYMKPVFPKIGVKIGAFFLFMIWNLTITRALLYFFYIVVVRNQDLQYGTKVLFIMSISTQMGWNFLSCNNLLQSSGGNWNYYI